VNALAGGSRAQRAVFAEMLGKVPSDWGSTIGVEGSGPSSLLFSTLLLIFEAGRGLAFLIRAAVRSWFLAMAAAERLKAAMSNWYKHGWSGGL
jgi:hypothetical protein